MSQNEKIHQLTAHLFRENSGKMTAALSRIFGLAQIDLILDIVQDTFEAALIKWKFSGVPDRPSAWLMKVAKNKAFNAIKRANKMERLSASTTLPDLVAFDSQFDLICSDHEIKDSQLKLLLICCQPVFSGKNQILITLHILCGFGVPELANGLLMKNEAVKKCLSRCKSTLRQAAHLMHAPTAPPSAGQLETLLNILYLMFNEGYKTTRTEIGINNDLCYEAIRLTRLLLDEGQTDNYKTNALLALMFFNLSRFPARLSQDVEWLTLEKQDRTLWNKVFVEEGFYYLNTATSSNRLHRFHLEAIIASIHCTAADFKDTEWVRIVYLYRQLEVLEPDSHYVKLNRIIAESYLQNTMACIVAINELEMNFGLQESFLFSVARADIYHRLGATEKAKTSYELALSLSNSPPDKKFLQRKIAECKSDKHV